MTMKILCVLAVGASLGVTTQAFAQDMPATADQCLKMAFDLAQSAEEKQLPDEEYKKLDDLLTTLESQCDAQQFQEASASAKDIRSKFGIAP